MLTVLEFITQIILEKMWQAFSKGITVSSQTEIITLWLFDMLSVTHSVHF